MLSNVTLSGVCVMHSYFITRRCLSQVVPKHRLKARGRCLVPLATSLSTWGGWQTGSQVPACCPLPPSICSHTSPSQQRLQTAPLALVVLQHLPVRRQHGDLLRWVRSPAVDLLFTWTVLLWKRTRGDGNKEGSMCKPQKANAKLFLWTSLGNQLLFGQGRNRTPFCNSWHWRDSALLFKFFCSGALQ